MVHSVYRPQTAHPLYAGKRLQRTVLGEGGLRPPSQILALRVYNMPTMSTISKPRPPVVHSVYRPQTAHPLYAGKRLQRTVLGEGGLRPPSQILALRVYNMPTVSTISRPRLLVVHIVYRPQTSQILALRVYNMPTVSTISRPRLLVVHSVYGPRPPSPSMRVNDGSGPFWGKGAFGPLPKYWHFASTTCRQCLQLVYSVYMCVCVCVYIYTHTYIYIYMSYDTVRRVVLCRTVSYSVVQCRTVSYCVVLCRTVSYCVVLCRTVSYCVVLCRTVSYSVYIHTYVYIYMSYDTVRRVVLCRTVSYCVVLCRTVSYCVVLCRTVSYCVVLCRTVSYCVVLCRTVSYCVVLCRTVSYCVVLCRTVSYSVYIHTYIYIYMSYDTVRRVVLCRTVSYCVVLCRTVSYCVVLCRTVSYCVVQCRTVLYCVVLCRTVSYCVVLCRTVSYCVVPASYDTVRRVVLCRTRCRGPTRRGCTTRRTVSYKVSGPDASGMYDASGGVGARRVVKSLLRQ